MKILKLIYRFYILLKPQYGYNIFAILFRMIGFTAEYIKYASMHRNEHFTFSMFDWYPCLTDKTETTPLDPVYFFQDAWAARKIFENKPKHHYDVGSSAKTIAIISQFVPTTMVDIRPVELQLENLYFQKGSILQLPFEDNSIDSISSLCVVEHIGLGRYGDPLDPMGSEKAIAELVRVTKPGGYIYFSVPVEKENKVYFNGHRSFSKEYLVSLFIGCTISEEHYIVSNRLLESFQSSNGYTVGLFSIRKGKL
ncbi:MAG: class I SAM-dependent methyltransferase [Ignavibacteriales bacterium]|nr:class I SAM-dependent methyltransferase [Ignavibacteriales bacterium]